MKSNCNIKFWRLTMNLKAIYCDIPRILETLENTTYEIKNFFKPKTNQFEFYYHIDEDFDEIADLLEIYEVLDNEFSEFLGVKRKVLNIIYNNCRNPAFGHLDFAVNMLDDFSVLLEAKIKLLDNFTADNQNEYNEIYLKYKNSMMDTDKEFHLNIFKPMHDVFTPQRVYEIMKECKW